jgi:hypothetical protein
MYLLTVIVTVFWWSLGMVLQITEKPLTRKHQVPSIVDQRSHTFFSSCELLNVMKTVRLSGENGSHTSEMVS